MFTTSFRESLSQFQQQQQKIVLVTGVFDLFHQEHRHFLEKAKQAGDVLIVGVESDVRVRQLKGEGRPIQNQATRVEQIETSGFADLVFILPEQFSGPADHERLISEIRPAVLAVSSHTPHLEKKSLILEKFGGKVVIVHQHNPEISTTKLVHLASSQKPNFR
jgi:rfaE bifunctional protein nucleotidyltransferase chain/domain